MAKYVVMYRDELGDCYRAYGSEALEKEYTYPDVDWDNELEVDVFYMWQAALEERLNEEWCKGFPEGRESHVFLERKYSDMSLSDWARLGYDVTPL